MAEKEFMEKRNRKMNLEQKKRINQHEGVFKCYMIWQMMMAMLHSNGQLSTERDGDSQKGCQKPAVQQTTDDNALSEAIKQRWQDSDPSLLGESPLP